MIHRPDDKAIREYFESNRLNASTLKKVATTVKSFEQDIKQSDAMLLGNIVETILMYENYEDYIALKEPNGLTGKTKSIVDDYLSTYNVVEDSLILEVEDKHEYYTNLKPDKRISKIRGVLEAEMDFYNSNRDKYICTPEMFDKALEMASNVKQTSWWQDIMNAEEVWLQKIIYFKYEGIEAKAMLDVLTRNGNKYTIYDIKTTGVVHRDFPKQYRNLRYDLQLSWYTIALESIVDFDAEIEQRIIAIPHFPPAMLIHILESDITRNRTETIPNLVESYKILKKYNFKREAIEDTDYLYIDGYKLVKNHKYEW